MSTRDEPWWAASSRSHVGATVTFLDARGITWQVSERACGDAPGARGPYCLVFDSGEVIRRVWDYPEQWRTLSGPALTELSWRR